MSGPQGHHSKESLLQNGRRESDLRGRHLTGYRTYEYGISAVARPRSRLASIQLGSCLSLVDRCAP